MTDDQTKREWVERLFADPDAEQPPEHQRDPLPAHSPNEGHNPAPAPTAGEKELRDFVRSLFDTNY